MSVEIIERIKTAENLPTLPAVAMQVLKLVQSEDVSITELVEVLQRDPALTGRILRIVNSSMFGMSRQITSLQQAIVVLGLRTVKVMVLGFSVVDTIKGSASEDFDYNVYWRRSLCTAVAARLLCKSVAPKLAEEAFVAGLLTDLGIVAAWRCAPDLYIPLHKSTPAGSLAATETSTLGVTHAVLTRELLTHWGLPQLLCDAAGAHHGESLDELRGTSLELARVVQVAATVSALFCAESSSTELNHVRETCQERLGIKAEAIETIFKALETQVRDTASVLALNGISPVNYQLLQAEAAMQLAKLSIQAEVERAETNRRAEETRTEHKRLEVENRRMFVMASTDALTGIPNRASFDQRIAEEVERALASGHELALIMLDVDDFKKFNDAYGHQAGDQILRAVGAYLKEFSVKVGFAARYGGEEFVVILSQKPAEQVAQLANEIRKAIASREVVHEHQRLKVTVSLGAFCTRGDAQPRLTPARLIEEADRRLYTAKRAGRNRVVHCADKTPTPLPVGKPAPLTANGARA